MASKIETSTPPNTKAPVGPIVTSRKSNSFEQFIEIGVVAGVDPASSELASSDIESQTMQIIDAFKSMIEAVGSDLDHIIQINVVLADMRTSPAGMWRT